MKTKNEQSGYLSQTKAHYEALPLDIDDGSPESGQMERVELEQKLFGQLLLRGLINEQMRVLDIGGGGGRNSQTIQRMTGASTVVADLSWTQVCSAHKRGLWAIQADALRLPFRANAFDVSIAYGSLHHTPSCHLGLVEEIRVTKPQGVVFFSVYRQHHPYFWLYHLLGPFCRRYSLGRQAVFYVWFWPALWLFRSKQLHAFTQVSRRWAWRFFGDQYLTPRATFHDRTEFETLAAYLGITIEECVADHAGQMISILSRKVVPQTFADQDQTLDRAPTSAPVAAGSIPPNWLLGILCCPEKKTRLVLGSVEFVAELNRNISQGIVKDRGGRVVRQEIHGALIRAGGDVCYPIRDTIPILLIDEAIPIDPGRTQSHDGATG